MTTPNRRRFPRARFGRTVAVRAGDRLFVAELEEVSEAGLRLEGAELDPQLSEVTVRVPLRGRYGRVDPCELRGRVVRRRDRTLGIALSRLLPRHQLQLRDYVWRATRDATP